MFVSTRASSSSRSRCQLMLPSPAGRRKVVLATNIAETSLTIEGIRLVVHCALERSAFSDLRNGLTSLQTRRVSRASMTRPAGYLEPHLPASDGIRRVELAATHSDSEILTSDLATLWLNLLQWGYHDISQLNWLDVPPATGIEAAR
ncbi:hypothetical protein [Candidatus Erwinia dacicola]